MKAKGLIMRTTSDGGVVPFFHLDTQDSTEMERRVKELEASHGAYTHIFFTCQLGILYMPRPITGLLILRNQPVVPATEQAQIQDITHEMIANAIPATDLPFFSWCLVPLICATNVPTDLWRGVPMQKVGVNTMQKVGVNKL